jgi:quercetin dioxygenase-like cupin family protein
MKPVSWPEIPEEKIGATMTRKMLWGENVMVVRVELLPKAVVDTHEHVSEQITIVERGSLILRFPKGEEKKLSAGDMLVIPASLPHGVLTGPDGCALLDIFSPIREDFISGKLSPGAVVDEDPYTQLQGYLRAQGIKIAIEELRELPLNVLARYTYERQCITMGQLRKILGLDKTQARSLLREWKHGDDHSESSAQRKLERLIVTSTSITAFSPAKSDS